MTKPLPCPVCDEMMVYDRNKPCLSPAKWFVEHGSFQMNLCGTHTRWYRTLPDTVIQPCNKLVGKKA